MKNKNIIMGREGEMLHFVCRICKSGHKKTIPRAGVIFRIRCSNCYSKMRVVFGDFAVANDTTTQTIVVHYKEKENKTREKKMRTTKAMLEQEVIHLQHMNEKLERTNMEDIERREALMTISNFLTNSSAGRVHIRKLKSLAEVAESLSNS